MYWQGKKTLVCGGAGMIGSALARELLKRGSRVTVVDDLSSGSLKNIEDVKKDLVFHKWDLRDPACCDRAVKGKDVVFQLACDMGGIGYITSAGATLMTNNTLINMYMLMAAHVHAVENYFFSSSACVYPNYKQIETDAIPLKEEDVSPADPNEFYGWEKLYCEKLVESFQRDFGSNIRVGRFHNIYGEAFTSFDALRGKAPCHIIMKAFRYPKQDFVLWGDGLATRSYCYIDDCIELVLRLMESGCTQPINIGSDRLISVDDLAALVIKISGKSIVPKHDLSKPQGVRGRNADLTLCEKMLDWKPKVPLEVGLERVYHWAEKHYDELEGL